MGYQIFQSFDEWADSNQHADMRVTLSSRQQTYWALDNIQSGNISVQWGQDAGPNVVEGSSPAGGLTLLIPQYNAESIIGNGTRMADGSIFMPVPQSEFCIASTDANRWSSVFIPYGQLTAMSDEKEHRHQRHCVLSPTAASENLRRSLENLAAASRDVPHASWSASAIDATTVRIARAVCEALSLPREHTRTLGRRILSRAEITRSALQVLEERCDQQVSVSELADATGISERTLRTVFEEFLGVSPARYLKNRTLHHVRGLLKQSDPFVSTVTEIALGLGILELGRFSRDYKMLFGESPSATLRENKV